MTEARDIAHQESAPAWRPIGTAPKDETLFLVSTSDGRMMIWRGDLLAGNLERQRAGRQPDHLSFPATHWQYLPKPPAR